MLVSTNCCLKWRFKKGIFLHDLMMACCNKVLLSGLILIQLPSVSFAICNKTIIQRFWQRAHFSIEVALQDNSCLSYIIQWYTLVLKYLLISFLKLQCSKLRTIGKTFLYQREWLTFCMALISYKKQVYLWRLVMIIICSS